MEPRRWHCWYCWNQLHNIWLAGLLYLLHHRECRQQQGLWSSWWHLQRHSPCRYFTMWCCLLADIVIHWRLLSSWLHLRWHTIRKYYRGRKKSLSRQQERRRSRTKTENCVSSFEPQLILWLAEGSNFRAPYSSPGCTVDRSWKYKKIIVVYDTI